MPSETSAYTEYKMHYALEDFSVEPANYIMRVTTDKDKYYKVDKSQHQLFSITPHHKKWSG